MNKDSIFFLRDVLCGDLQRVCKRETSLFNERRIVPYQSQFGSHHFSVAATELGGLGRTKMGGSYTPS